MPTKSKLNPLNLIIIVAILLFIAAALWKFTNVDNSEEVYVPPIAKDKTITNKKREIVEDDYDLAETDEDNFSDLSKQEKMVQMKEESEKAFHNHLFLQTPEDILNLILKAQEKGDSKLEGEYIDLLIEKFPDYKIK